ncbi:hypothetical protein [Aquipseudomonas ullengensis]|uniref:Uncharacterized protein n=1 Tax=Aquipseudomonas ullengensis TaxID=2759166 RepID=A0A7W4LK33_9GAMM|nr:hypothetical protein [Pseudomonas ullengensis]MBB2494482.1 hypothetical protein [Pseudomonas ullengensis]
MSASPEQTDGYVLCQDCSHVEPYTSERHHGRENCPKCGGSFCGCNACSELARLALQFQEPSDEQEAGE